MKNLLVVLINFIYGIIPYKGTVVSLFGGIQKNARVYSLISVFTYAEESLSVIDVFTITRKKSWSLFGIFIWAEDQGGSFFSLFLFGNDVGVVIWSLFVMGNKVTIAVLSTFAVATDKLDVMFCSLFSYTDNKKEDVSIGFGLLNSCKEGLV